MANQTTQSFGLFSGSGGGGGGAGTVTSVAMTVPAALSVSGSPITSAGTLAVTGAGTTAQYIDGTGALQTTVNNVIINWSFYDNSVRDVYIPLSSEQENTTIQRYNRFISPFNGELKSCSFVSSILQTGGTGTLTLAFGSITGTSTFTAIETATVTLPLAQYTPASFVFTATSSLTAGGRYAFFLSGQGTLAVGNCVGTLLFEIT